MTTDKPKEQIIYLYDDGNVVPKATACRIIEYDAAGERVRETYLVRTDEGEEVS